MRTPKAIAESVKVENFDLDIYSLESGCPLNEPQLNVYLDIVAHDKKDSYIIPHNISVSKKYGLDEEKAYFTGLIHDCAKCLPKDEM